MSDKEFTPTEPILMDAPAADIPATPAEDKPSAAKPAAPSVAPTETRPPVDVPLDPALAIGKRFSTLIEQRTE